MAERVVLRFDKLGLGKGHGVEYTANEMFGHTSIDRFGRLSKNGFGPTMIDFLDGVYSEFGGKIRNDVAREVILAYRSQMCSGCIVAGNCSKIISKRSFLGEVYPEMRIESGGIEKADKAPCYEVED